MANKKLLVVLFLLIFLICGLLAFNFFFLRKGKLLNEEITIDKKATVSNILLFAPPVEKAQLKTGKPVQLDLNVNSLGFKLPENAVFLAGIDGSVEITGKEPQQFIIIYSNDGKKRLHYLFNGTALVQNGQRVIAGKVIGKTGSGTLPTRNENLIVRYFEDGKEKSLDTETLNKLINE